MTREQQEELLFEFVEWLRTEYQVEDVYEMYVPEFLDDVVLPQPDVSGELPLSDVTKCGKCEILGDAAPCDECYRNGNFR